MHCLVTAGPTFEPIDQVRRLTNFSTGRLGSELAACLAAAGHQVTLLLGEQATWTNLPTAAVIERFTTVADLEARLRARAGTAVGAVFHAAAVGDFRCGSAYRRTEAGTLERLTAGKLSTRDGAVMLELIPTLKILPNLRDWFPSARITGWKYEVDGDRQAALERGRQQLGEARSDACVVNGPAYGPGFGLVTPTGERDLVDRGKLFAALLRSVMPTPPTAGPWGAGLPL